MNNVEVIQPLINFIFPFILLITIYVVYRFIVSLWPKQIELNETELFKKGKTQYSEPPRPNSPKFNYLFRLSRMETPTQQDELVNLTSDMIKDIFYLKYNQISSNISQNLELFVSSPNSWLQQKYKHLEAQNRLKDKKYASNFLYEEFKLILKEIEEFFPISFYKTED